MKNEGLDWLADNPLYTKRFAFTVGRRCRQTTVQEVAEDLFLDWHAVKELDKQYMREQLVRAGSPAPRVIGIDELAIAKGHKYRIVVSDLERGRPIWFGGQDRSEESMDEFFAWLGPEKCRKIRLAVMDMWKAFRNSTLKEGNAPQATILTTSSILMHRSLQGPQGNTPACRATIGGLSRGSGTRSFRTGGTSPLTAGHRCGCCSRPTSGSTLPISSRSHLANCGITKVQCGRGDSSISGGMLCAGND